MSSYYIYASCWAGHGDGKGLGLYTMDSQTGNLRFLQMLDENTSFNCSVIDKKHRRIFVNNETEKVGRTNLSGGQVVCFTLDPMTGEAKKQFTIPTHTPNPSYVNVMDDGEYLVVAHHSTGRTVTHFYQEDDIWKVRYEIDDPTVQLYHLEKDGYALKDVRVHVMPQRIMDGRMQTCHPHCAVVSPSGNLLAVCDKGDFNIYIYRLSRSFMRLELCDIVPTGGQARYCAFHPTKPFLFVNHEGAVNEKGEENTPDGDMKVQSYRYSESGQLEKICEVSVKNVEIPAGEHYEQQGFVMHPDGNLLFSVLNGPDQLVSLRVDQEDGTLTVADRIKIEGDRPRGCAISPDGKYILVSCMRDGNIFTYTADKNGKLTLVSQADHKLIGCSYMTFYDTDEVI